MGTYMGNRVIHGIYPLVNFNVTMEHHNAIARKTHYFYCHVQSRQTVNFPEGMYIHIYVYVCVCVNIYIYI